ncbi:threonine synthase [Candidatus Woesearchaeota archaeon]|jgi:threonine synthase|nr:threonine synthase [Candidatus Woesearchaeota archaeon]MBT3537503.1 threonine synthase [Candidatus Woesearchaeota archaeon]MBT4696807.1 threonine synthase [Candidatus Woesearchaeota archaeon]MBT4717628.1 threonine synthase [Candidatus Woesearchaeota archaeon]MBT7106187.1 threonine synthase [Candidatus Woesearchaeota archaeon]
MTVPKQYRCVVCKRTFSYDSVIFSCPKCGGSLDIEYDYKVVKKKIIKSNFVHEPVNHWKYWMFYPTEDLSNIVSFKEGGTPLIDSVKTKGYMFKHEGISLSGAFKDRGTTIEISKARELGVKDVACATTGNMGGSVSAYCARAGINAHIFIPKFAPANKLAQIRAHGAKVKVINGTYEDAVTKTLEMREKYGCYLSGDYPHRGEGEKSVGFEIVDQLNWMLPDYIVTPVGNATLFSGVYKSLEELKKVGLIKKLPRLVAVQGKGCSPLVTAFDNHSEIKEVKKPKTVASAICCGRPVDGEKALKALRNTKGFAVSVTDKEIVGARKLLASEGIFAEPSGAVSYAGALKLGLKGEVVCVLTGHGLKDPVL